MNSLTFELGLNGGGGRRGRWGGSLVVRRNSTKVTEEGAGTATSGIPPK